MEFQRSPTHDSFAHVLHQALYEERYHVSTLLTHGKDMHFKTFDLGPGIGVFTTGPVNGPSADDERAVTGAEAKELLVAT